MGRFRKRFRGIVSPAPTNQLPITSQRPLVERDDDLIARDSTDRVICPPADGDICPPADGEQTFGDQRSDVSDERLSEPPKAGTHTETLFTQSRLYEATKPLIEIIKLNIENMIAKGYGGVMNRANSWSTKRKVQFIDHVFRRLKTIFNINDIYFLDGLSNG